MSYALRSAGVLAMGSVGHFTTRRLLDKIGSQNVHERREIDGRAIWLWPGLLQIL